MSIASTAALMVTAPPAGAASIDLKAPTVICGSGAPYLALLVSISPSSSGFGASATAHMCNATAIETVVAMQAVGAGASTSPSVTGGPLLFAPFNVKSGNDAHVSGSSTAPSATAQTVVVNVTGAGVGVLSEPTNSCQIVYDRVLGQVLMLNGCNAAVTVLA